MSLDKLGCLLSDRSPEVIGLRGIPNARLEREVRIMEWLSSDVSGIMTKSQFLDDQSDRLKIGIDPEDILKLGRELSYWVEICLSRTDINGSYNAVLRRICQGESPVIGLGAALYDEEMALSSLEGYCNNPLQGKIAGKLIPELRGYLQDKLPEYMVPSGFMVLSDLLLTPNGKIDRGKLPAPWDSRVGLSQAYVAPRTSIEKTLAGIWSEVLGIDRIGIHDNFFEIGGHSLLATQVISRLRDVFSVELPVRAMFESQSLEELSRKVRRVRWARSDINNNESNDESEVMEIVI